MIDVEKNTPLFPRKLAGSFWGITTFFNPSDYKIKKKNYRLFRKSLQRQGLKLVCVELVYGNRDFQLNKSDADIFIQLRTNEDVLWQKERLLNIALKRLPADCDKIAWLDADIIFMNNAWIEDTIRLLESYIVVQPFECAFSLNKNFGGLNNLDSLKIDQYPIGIEEGCRIQSMAYGISQNGKITDDYMLNGHSGYAWAGRRELFDKYGFYDRNVFCGSDVIMGYGFYGKAYRYFYDNFCTKSMREDIEKWQNDVFRYVRSSVYFSKGFLAHLWHGSYRNRRYGIPETAILKKNDFDPGRDLKLDNNGCWIWKARKAELINAQKHYLWMRNEDGRRHRDALLFLKKNLTPQKIITALKGAACYLKEKTFKIFKPVLGKTFFKK